MVFSKHLRERIRRGRIRCSIRIWTRPHVKVGGRYQMDEGHIVVDSIAPMAIGDVTDDLARESGFESVDDLLRTAHTAAATTCTDPVPLLAAGRVGHARPETSLRACLTAAFTARETRRPEGPAQRAEVRFRNFTDRALPFIRKIAGREPVARPNACDRIRGGPRVDCVSCPAS